MPVSTFEPELNTTSPGNLAALFAQRVIVLDRGRIAGDGTPAATITDTMLEAVFGVSGAVGRAAASGLPCVPPHQGRSAAAR